MPYQGLQDGLYIVKQRSQEKGVDHYGVLDVGNRIRHPHANGVNPVIVHQTPPSVRIDWFESTKGNWDVLGRVTDEAAAIARMHHAFKNPTYDIFGHNCEHFARFVANGKKESAQLQSLGVALGLVTLVFVAAR